MKPEVSVMPERDRTTEERKPLTKTQRAKLALEQGGRCGCGCGGKLDHAGEGTIDEHVQPLGLHGTNDLENRQIWRKPCSDAKTYRIDLPMMAKAKAQGGETGQYARRQKNGSRLKSAPFQKHLTKGFDGKVRPSKSLRQKEGGQ